MQKYLPIQSEGQPAAKAHSFSSVHTRITVHKVQAVCHVGSSLLHRAHHARMVGSCSPLLVLQVRGAPFVRAPPQQRYAARSYGPLAGGVKVGRCPAAPEGNPVDCGLRQVEAA